MEDIEKKLDSFIDTLHWKARELLTYAPPNATRTRCRPTIDPRPSSARKAKRNINASL